MMYLLELKWKSLDGAADPLLKLRVAACSGVFCNDAEAADSTATAVSASPGFWELWYRLLLIQTDISMLWLNLMYWIKYWLMMLLHSDYDANCIGFVEPWSQDPIPSQLGLAISSSFPVDNGPHSCLLDTSETWLWSLHVVAFVELRFGLNKVGCAPLLVCLGTQSSDFVKLDPWATATAPPLAYPVGELGCELLSSNEDGFGLIQVLVAAMEVPHAGTAVECIDDLAVENSTSIGCSLCCWYWLYAAGAKAADAARLIVMQYGMLNVGVLLCFPVLQFLDAVSLKGFAGQSTLDVLHCRVLMPTGLIRLRLILMWVVTDAGVHVALELLCDSELKHVLVFLIPKALFFCWFACCCSDMGCVAWSCMMLFAGCRSATTDDFADLVADAPGL
ncbi:hypothetical protein Nepgr_017394 [Nepenthes gracilis]|uniref:Uncharacterized protein n=1 Tax=Nepenthes gracilis TaxID=150966 RepID=A0AAD3XSF7_NEPGR|nr:hypothetical protein Nepgr_017394 [Nepenthes gracilis]